MRNLIFVDCEWHGPAPGLNDDALFEAGFVDYSSRLTFHLVGASERSFAQLDTWLSDRVGRHRPVFVSDNPAYDWQFVNYYFHRFLGHNPFGHSARRISDFYAGLTGDWGNTQAWKSMRVTDHDHNPVHDAMGNVEAFERMLNGERGVLHQKRA